MSKILSNAACTLGCALFVLVMGFTQDYAQRVNPKDLEFIGTLGLGIVIFSITGIVYLVKTIKHIHAS